MKNKLSDLNNHLFEQLERLNDDDLNEENLNKEIKRSKAMSDIASNIIDIVNASISAQKLLCEYDRQPTNMSVLRELTTKDSD